MIVDSSALVALLTKEPGFERLRATLQEARKPLRMASASYLETAIVIDGRESEVGSAALDEALEEFGIEIVPFTADHARIARQAYREYGRGKGHPAKLNFGDSIAYALARSEGAPLLFVGNDFPHTDIEVA